MLIWVTTNHNFLDWSHMSSFYTKTKPTYMREINLKTLSLCQVNVTMPWFRRDLTRHHIYAAFQDYILRNCEIVLKPISEKNEGCYLWLL